MNPHHPKFVITAVVLLFFIPLLLAVLMRSSWWDFVPAGSSNRGLLVEPPQAFPATALEVQHAAEGTAFASAGAWVLLYTFAGECGPECSRDTMGLRQVHIASGRNRHLVSLWLLAPRHTTLETQGKLLDSYPGFNILVDSTGSATAVLDSLNSPATQNRPSWHNGRAFLLDPANNIILRYAPGFDPDDINQDLDRLLTWSEQD